MSKIVLFELFEADITIKDSSGFIVNSIKPVEDTKIISLYVDNTEVSSGFYFSFNKKYTIEIYSFFGDKESESFGLFSNVSHSDLLFFEDKKYYDLKVNINTNKLFEYDVAGLVTSEYNKVPLFYKFFLSDFDSVSDLKIFDSFKNEVTNFNVYSFHKNHVVYFAPSNNGSYSYKNNDVEDTIDFAKATTDKIFKNSFSENSVTFTVPKYIDKLLIVSGYNFLSPKIKVVFLDDSFAEFDVKVLKNEKTCVDNNFVTIGKIVKSVTVFSNEETNTNFASVPKLLCFTQETRTLFKENKYFFVKQKESELCFTATEHKSFDLDKMPNFDFLNLKTDTKYLFDGNTLIPSEDGNFKIKNYGYEDFMFMSKNLYNTNKRFYKTLVAKIQVPNDSTLEYFKTNFKAIQTKIEAGD